MLEKTRDQRIGELYKTANYSMRKLANMYNISQERIRQLLVREIGQAEIKNVKMIRKMKVADKLREDYLK